MNNYEKMMADARLRFTAYDKGTLAQRPGVRETADELITKFLGETVHIPKKTGELTVGGRKADFGETLAVFDWLCDGKPNAKAAGEYCAVGSLPGIYVGGSGLMMSGGVLAKRIDAEPHRFRAACHAIGGRKVALGDLGFEIPVFPGVAMCLKFYFGDEEFPPQLTFLWDQNMLQFVRYETVYYIAGCVQKRLLGTPAGC